jgi:GlpG protein
VLSPRAAGWREELTARVAAPVTFAIMLVCTGTYLVLALLFENAGDALPWLAGWSHEVWNGRYWTLLTAAFVHVEIWHIVMNMMALRVLGTFMEVTVGGWRWMTFYLTAAFVSSGAELALSGTTGIGASGVLYAAFGFMWVTRQRYPLFARIVTPRNTAIAIGWLVLCVPLTVFNVLPIGNGAHFAGLLFGAGLGAVLAHRRWRWGALFLLLALAGMATTALFWCPWLGAWNGWHAIRAHKRGDLELAATQYYAAIARGYNPSWAWHNLGLLAAARGNWAEYEKVWAELSCLDTIEAARMESGVWDYLAGAYGSWLQHATEKQPEEELVAGLAAGLATTPDQQTTSSVIVLGVLGRRAASAIPELRRLARSDCPANVRAAALLALRRMDGAQSEKAGSTDR